MYQSHDRDYERTPERAPGRTRGAGPGTGAPDRETDRPATREPGTPPRWSAPSPSRDPLGAVEAYYDQSTLQHAPSFY